ncbi:MULTISPECIES: hypothetical protein [unclassified Rhodococcus (in: high G+C Gram-positive bacteria)]|uniref:hypothetical protein n=1 Tax=Rhodococcus sp. SJ-3 TaxID=3454628 RepID=UPI003F7AB965
MNTIVMTVGSSGFGEVAAQLACQAGMDLLVGARTVSPDFIPVDLACLNSVRTFADLPREHLSNTPLDLLALNAGSIMYRGERVAGAAEAR